jgi:ribosomal protein S18 acetylase RimI-like enzyme
MAVASRYHPPMSRRTPYESVASLGPDLGRVTECHFALTLDRLLHGEGVIKDDRGITLITGEAHPFGNFVIPATGIDAASLRESIVPLLELDVPSAVVVSNGAMDRACVEALERDGYGLMESMPAMAMNIEDLGEFPATDGVEFRRAGGPEVEAWIEALAEGYELPLGVAKPFGPPKEDRADNPAAPMQFFAGVRDGEFVCTSMVNMQDGVAGVYCIATAPSARRKGLGAWITAETLRVSERQGYKVGVLQASASGFPVYARMGFQEVGSVPMYVRIPTD